MADISQIIQQGQSNTRADLTGWRGDIDSMSQNKNRRDITSIYREANARKNQEFIDEKASQILGAGAFYQRQIDSLTQKINELQNSGDPQAKQALPALYEQNGQLIQKRNDLVKSTFADPKLGKLLHMSSFSNDAIGDMFLHPDVWDSMNPQEQEELMHNVLGTQMGQQEYAEDLLFKKGLANGKNINLGNFIPNEPPKATQFSEDVFYGHLSPEYKGLGNRIDKAKEREAKHWYQQFVAPFKSQEKGLMNLTDKDKAVLQKLYSGWSGGTDEESVKNFVNYVRTNVKKGGVSSMTAQNLRSTLLDVVATENPELIGAYIDMTKKYLESPKVRSVESY